MARPEHHDHRAVDGARPQLFSGYNPLEGTAGAQRLAPQAGHWLGTDQLGRDLWTRIVYGAVHSLSAALAAVAIGLLVGTALGTLAGAVAGRVESLVMRWLMSCWPSRRCCCH